MDNIQREIWDILSLINDGETVARLITDYHGLQLFDKGFLEFLEDEGY